jgi:hypothetical protein
MSVMLLSEVLKLILMLLSTVTLIREGCFEASCPDCSLPQNNLPCIKIKIKPDMAKREIWRAKLRYFRNFIQHDWSID